MDGADPRETGEPGAPAADPGAPASGEPSPSGESPSPSAEAPSDEPSPAGHGEQLALIRETVKRAKPKARAKGRPKTAARLPVARVVVDKPLTHLDQHFDYAVPAKFDEDAVPGARVRVRFGGHVVEGRRTGGELIDGYLVERRETSDYKGPLAPLRGVLSAEPVLSPELLTLCRAVADRYAGTLADVLQLAVPPRHARTEAEPSPPALPAPEAPAPAGWERYPSGAGYLQALASGGSPRAVWTALPGPPPDGEGPGWAEELARAVAAALASGRGALAVVPDAARLAPLDTALTRILGEGRHVALAAGLGPAERYRRWLAVSRGSVRAVAGTRAAMFAPVRDLGLVAIWDDGDDSHAERHAPRPHAREVLLLRAHAEGAGALVGGHARTVEGAQLIASGWARPLDPERAVLRALAPRIRTVTEADEARDEAARAARLPSVAWHTVRDGLRHGPVLVQVPRRGYLPRLTCVRCREPVRCTRCAGPLELPAQGAVLRCRWCGRPEAHWHCQACGSDRLRAVVVGAARTADELGRAFPSVPVRTSGGDAVLGTVPDAPALVVATPGAEPAAERGYAAGLLLDGWAMLGRPDLRVGEEALRRWLGAAALVRGARDGGQVVVVAEPTLRPVQALVRWDPGGHAESELAERAELGFPPVARMASVTGPRAAVAELVSLVRMPDGGDVLGPVPVPSGRAGEEPQERALLRVPQGRGGALAAALKAAQAVRAARRGSVAVQVQVDPRDLA